MLSVPASHTGRSAEPVKQVGATHSKKELARQFQRYQLLKEIVQHRGVSIRFACVCMSVSESCYHYQPKLSSENAVIGDWLLRLSVANKRWGFGLCFLYLRNVKGFPWNHKRVYRIYRELELNLRIKPRRRLKRGRPDVLSVPTSMNQVWSIDFMSDRLMDGRKSAPSM